VPSVSSSLDRSSVVDGRLFAQSGFKVNKTTVTNHRLDDKLFTFNGSFLLVCCFRIRPVLRT
jgi:hypothetical protein